MKRRVKRWFQQKIDRTVHDLATKGMPARQDGETDFHAEFMARCRAMQRPSVLELGTLRSNPAISTRHDDWVPNAGEFLGFDIAPGLDVDIVGDVHRLTQATGTERFDAIISCSTFEHFKYPHLAAHEVMKALKVGGVLFVQTHQSFPLHAYPYDYFRFSREALAGLFGSQMGFRVIVTDYEFPVKLYSPRDMRAAHSEAYLNVRLYGEKSAVTPAAYVYEFDVA